jgi:uncharacterized protein YecE (DUF72 family)
VIDFVNDEHCEDCSDSDGCGRLASAVSAEIRVGTSGWNYPAGQGTWNGVFYPRRRPRGFDELAYYAEHFDIVEVNSSFYRMPDPALTQKWIDRTPPGFLFSMKLYQKFTHPDMYLARDGVRDWNVSAGDFDEFRRGLDPLVDAGRLSALLIQFPPSFHAGDETRAYLDWLLEGLREYPLAVELRHRSWSDAADDTDARLGARQAAWVAIDEPKFRDSIAPDLQVGAEYYRLHGRNAAAWWDHAESEDRYNYLYSRAELAPFAERARRTAASGKRVQMFLNNHFSAKAVANASVLKHLLEQPVSGEYPREMVDLYPELEGIVTTSGLPL